MSRPSLTALVSHPIRLLRRWGDEDRLIGPAAHSVNARHLRMATLVVLALNLMHMTVFGLWHTGATPTEATWAQRILWAHAGMAVLMTREAWTLKTRPDSPQAHHLPVITAAAVLLWSVALTLADQSMTTNISAYLNASAGVAITLLLRPVQALALYALSGMVLAWGLGLVSPGHTTLLTNQLNVATASVLALMVSVLLWRRFVQTELLQQALARSNHLLAQQHAELEILATRDPLTGLLNRREFLHRARQELARTRRDHTPLSILMLDLDHFKNVNDRFGHPAGDAVLRHMASLMVQSVRSTDLLARWGGEEFVVLLPNTDAPSALVLADKLRLKLADTPTIWKPDHTPIPIALTTSIGLSSLQPGHTASMAELDALLSQADQALYAAKHAGRNRVVVADPN